MFVSINIVGFRDTGISNVLIYKVLDTDTSNKLYFVEVDNEFAAPTYYKVCGSDGKIEKLIARLESVGNKFALNEVNKIYELYAYKYYDVFAAKPSKTKTLIERSNINPINQEFKVSDNVTSATFDEVFGYYFNGVELN
jgi:hypothetical protein